jgi:arylsulfatase A-like enzyme
MVVAIIAAFWSLVAFGLGPWFIRLAYQENSLAVFNAMLAGRAQHPVQHYIDAWFQLTLRASLAALALGACVSAGVRFSGARRRVLGWVVGGSPSISDRALLLAGLLFGVLAGLAEAIYLGLRQLITHRPAAGFFPELFWSAPGSSAAATLIVVGFVIMLSKLAGRGVGLWQATLILAFLPLYGVMQSEGIPLHPLAAVFLSLGMASVVARVAVRQGATVERVVRATPALVGTLASSGLALALLLSPAFTEFRKSLDPVDGRLGLPNVLLIILDTVRATNLSVYGYDRPTTPRLEDLAASGVVFDRALATWPWTLPSHSTMFTGQYNYRLGTGSWQPLDDRFPTLAEVFREQGYATAGFVGNPFYTTRMSGLQRGFERYEEIPVVLGRILTSSWLGRTVLWPVHALIDDTPPDVKRASTVTREFLHWHGKRGDQPFFAFLNLFDAHSPYEPPEPFEDFFGTIPAERWFDFEYRWREGTWTAAQRDQWLAMYDGAIRYMDEQVGAILDSLEARGVLDNTIVVVTSDHGEMWGERGLFGHANTVYDPVLHVPLIIQAPGKAPAGTRIRQAVTLRDLGATLILLAGVEPQVDFPGTPWVLDGRPWKGSPLLARVSPDPRDGNTGPFERGEMRSLYEGSLHYIVEDTGAEELYDLASDPLETRNLIHSAEYGQVVTRFRAQEDSSWPEGLQ